MITVGEIFTAARNRKKLTLEQVEKAIKIRQKFLLALEKNEFQRLPPGTFTKGFIKNYAAFLGLPIEETMAFYRRQVNEEKAQTLPSLSQNPPSKRLFPFLSPMSIGVSLLIILFFAYLIYSYFRFAGSPVLAVASPAQNSVTSEEQIDISGKTDPDAQLTINNQPVSVEENGSFNTKISLTPGLNTLTIVATNKFHRQTTITRNLRLEK